MDMLRFLSKIFLIFFCWNLTAQPISQREKLQQQRAKLMDEIKLANYLLQENRTNRANSLTIIETLTQKIRIREQLIDNLQAELEYIQREIEESSTEIQHLEEEVRLQREHYAQMIRKAYNSRSPNMRLLFILSSQDLWQAIRRMQYLNQLAKARRKQVELTKQKEKQLQEYLNELNAKRISQQHLLANQTEERNQLAAEKRMLEELVQTLNIQSRQLERQIAEKQQQSRNLEREIQRLIALEIKRAREAAERKALEERAASVGLAKNKDYTAKTSNAELERLIARKKAELEAAARRASQAASATPRKETPSTTIPAQTSAAADDVLRSTPEARQLAANFAANRTRLPWPVEKGIIVQRYGKQQHEVAKYVVVDNPGINIATERGAKARAVFDGEVSGVLQLPDGSMAVLIKHGNFFTVYANMTNILVKAGDRVRTKQDIGTVFTDFKEGKTILHFEVWEGSRHMDPLLWLQR
ncbi:peptidase [Thermaurantimonas aggregans]|uniref:Peptidase n=1 Tax=Thermaurantimonas aggregans TaxID=2173829 RepID=A0A401XLC5_9FLAO|nr:peptidoglycan DD-metalloendopeptidase family protein [Thermaurantimonas aggregans]GCD77826.1 peptidase [Thermaurantimonas aggregans]